MWFDSWTDIARIALSSLCIYALIILVLLVAGKRSLAKLKVFDSRVDHDFEGYLAERGLRGSRGA